MKQEKNIAHDAHVIGRRKLTLKEIKEIRECNCDIPRFCPIHQKGCEKHDSLCPDGHCTCKTLTKEDAIRLKKKINAVR